MHRPVDVEQPSPKNESVAAELRRFVRFTADDGRRIGAFGPRAAPAFERLATQFYALAVLTDAEQIGRLERALVSWLEGLFAGTYDDAHFERTERIGDAHVQVGLPQRYVIGAMAVLRASLGSVIDGHGSGLHAALARLLDVELGVMLESYVAFAAARVDQAIQVAASKVAPVVAVDLAPMLVVGLDAAANVVFLNRVAERMTGYARDEALGRPFVELLVLDEDRVTVAPALGVDGGFESSLRTCAGQVRTMRWQVARGEGTTFAFGLDVTDERDQREQSQQSQRLAAAGILVAGLAHEIRNPLNGAGLHLAILERSLASEGSAEKLDTVRIVSTELRRLASLVTDFLDFARPKPLAVISLNAQALCARAIARVSAAAAAAGVTVETDLPPQDLVFDADRAHLEHVLVHLLENGIDAVGQAGRVVLRARREPRYACIEVEDNGPGLPDRKAPIFDPFYSTKIDGTGLGLAIAYRIVSNHDGHLDFDSRPGCTRFRVRLPHVAHRSAAIAVG
ncbi:MAG: ATP-binding protein [Labilithrix sp.]